jgi:uncharacterized membrane protein YecN with MAPEG domain
MILPITLTVAAALTILNVGLALHVVRRRFGGRIMNGTGGDALMEARTRAQANLVEYAPFFLILLGLVELAGASTFWLWIAGVVFVLARITHAFGMMRPAPNPFRAAGALLTWALLLLLSGWALATAYAARPAGALPIAEPSDVRA